MILVALLIHYKSDNLLQDLQVLIQSISGGGLLALTLLGMLTIRVDSRNAIIAVAMGLLGVCLWLFLDTDTVRAWLAENGIANEIPNKFWMHVFVNVFVFALGYLLAVLFPSRRRRDLADLTVWTARDREPDLRNRDPG